MLNLIGLGLFDEKDLTLRGLEVCKNSNKVYLEIYTSKWSGSVEGLEKIMGKKVFLVERSDLEEKSKKILKEADDSDISLLVLGDPLVATTHLTLLLDAKREGIKTEIVHNASIYSSVGESGLQLYKFGATVTIPFSEKTNNQPPESIYRTIKKNKSMGLHTLCLLDLVSSKSYMSPNQGMEILLGSKFISDVDEILVMGRLGSKDPVIAYGKIQDLIERDFGEPPFVLIIPGNLHFMEKEYLDCHRVG